MPTFSRTFSDSRSPGIAPWNVAPRAALYVAMECATYVEGGSRGAHRKSINSKAVRRNPGKRLSTKTIIRGKFHKNGFRHSHLTRVVPWSCIENRKPSFSPLARVVSTLSSLVVASPNFKALFGQAPIAQEMAICCVGAEFKFFPFSEKSAFVVLGATGTFSRL